MVFHLKQGEQGEKMHLSCRPYCTTTCTSDTASTSYQVRLYLTFNHQMFINFWTSLIKLCLWWVSATQLQTSSTKSSRIKDQCYFLLNHLKVKPCNKYHIRMFLRTIDKWVLIHICTYHTDLELESDVIFILLNCVEWFVNNVICNYIIIHGILYFKEIRYQISSEKSLSQLHLNIYDIQLHHNSS